MRSHAITRRPNSVPVLAALVGTVLVCASAYAQSDFAEGFDNVGATSPQQPGPQSLVDAGWMFRNQSAPAGGGVWQAGINDWFPPRDGAGYLCVQSDSTDDFGGDISQWMILPGIPNQAAGDKFTFYFRRFSSSNQDVLQVRYSPGGGTGTGSGPTAVGDFSILLAEFDPIPLTGWTPVTVDLPGAGRLAIRYVVNDACNFGCFASYVGIDTLTLNQAPPSGPALPAPGETVHWTSAQSPIVLSSDASILAGGTVIVDPGVQVQIEDNAVLYVLGAIHFSPGSQLAVESTANLRVEGVAEFLGSSESPITLTGGVGGWFGKGLEIAPGGTARLDHVQSDLTVFVHWNEVLYGEDTKTIVIDNSSFTGDGDVRIGEGSLAIRNTSFAGPTVEVLDSYVLLDNVNMNGSVLQSFRWHPGQPLYLNHIDATNVTQEAPFQLHGYDYFFGPDNDISGNLYPVHLVGGGIARGSTLPLSGNINNYVHGGIGSFLGRVTFADAGLPYRIDFDPSFPQISGFLTIDPGATVRFGPGAYFFSYFESAIIAEGLPDAPIVFERFDPAQEWESISFRTNTRPKMEHCIVRGSAWGFGADETVVRLESCRMEGNGEGAAAYARGHIVARKCQFIDNGIGLRTSPGVPAGFGSGSANLDGDTNPNFFESNAVALEVQNPLSYSATALHNWWGDPSGPVHFSNPGGQGELVNGFAHVVPFRTEAPNVGDHPPVVRLEEHAFLLEEGRKVILHWTAFDDAVITGFRVDYSPHSENPPLELLLDGIPGSARSVEIVVPPAPPSSNNARSVLRVTAIDNAGQEGWDEIMFDTPYPDFIGSVVPHPIAGVFRPGEHVPICYDVLPGSSGSVDAVLFIESDMYLDSLGGAHTGVTCLSLGMTVPPVSTDLARIGVRYTSGAGGRWRWEFTDYFSIRPDASLGDAPPAVQLLAPSAGQSYAGGSVVPVSWEASDDEALRSFDVQASYDGSRTWHIVARDLPGDSTSYPWRLPASAGVDEVRVRVIARDLRFQTTSSTGGPFTVLPGLPAETGDIDGDGDVDLFDAELFRDVLLGANTNAEYVARSDLNGDAITNGRDIQPFVESFLAH